MTNTSQFIENAKAHLETLGAELSDLENKVVQAGQEMDEWSSNHVTKLKNDWEQAKSEMNALADRIESDGEASVEEAKAKAQHHWDALNAAVQTYRRHVEKTTAS